MTGDEDDIRHNMGYKLNKIWFLDEKVELKQYLHNMIQTHQYQPQDIFTIEEFQLFYSLPLDQIFDMNSIDKGIKQSASSSENSLTIMLGTNLIGTEKLSPMIVGKPDTFDVSKSSSSTLKNFHHTENTHLNLMNKITEAYRISYKSNINKWITSTMFQNYLLTLEHKLASSDSNRKLLIIVDDSSTHRILNLKLNNIRLVYLKNNTNHKSPFNSLHNGVNFDYCPMNFGIVHEFKTLYRLQQYLEMINIQKNSQNKSEKPMEISIDNFKLNSTTSSDVLSESEYSVPLIKAIEWVKRAWDSVSRDKIVYSWAKTHLINVQRTWPDPQVQSLVQPHHAKLSRSYDKLNEVMKYLNVVLPWNIDELLGLVNERVKATLNYISIEEIVASCLLESESEPHASSLDHDISDTVQMNLDDDWLMNQLFESNVAPTAEAMTNMETSTMGHTNMGNTTMRDTVMENTDIVSGPGPGPASDMSNTMSIGALIAAAESEGPPTKKPHTNQTPDPMFLDQTKALTPRSIVSLIANLLEAVKTNQLSFSPQTYSELQANLSFLRAKSPDTTNDK